MLDLYNSFTNSRTTEPEFLNRLVWYVNLDIRALVWPASKSFYVYTFTDFGNFYMHSRPTRERELLIEAGTKSARCLEMLASKFYLKLNLAGRMWRTDEAPGIQPQFLNKKLSTH